MGFGDNAIQAGSLDYVDKSKARKKKEGEEKESGCWAKLSFIGSCIPSRSKVENSISGTNTDYGNCLCIPLLQFWLMFFSETLISAA